MDQSNKLAVTVVSIAIIASLMSVMLGYKFGYNSGRHDGIGLGVDYTLDTLQTIISKSAELDTSRTIYGQDTVVIMKYGRVTRLTIVSKDTVSYFLSRKTIKP